MSLFSLAGSPQKLVRSPLGPISSSQLNTIKSPINPPEGSISYSFPTVKSEYPSSKRTAQTLVFEPKNAPKLVIPNDGNTPQRPSKDVVIDLSTLLGVKISRDLHEAMTLREHYRELFCQIIKINDVVIDLHLDADLDLIPLVKDLSRSFDVQMPTELNPSYAHSINKESILNHLDSIATKAKELFIVEHEFYNYANSLSVFKVES